jgi:hypothetical protein
MSMLLVHSGVTLFFLAPLLRPKLIIASCGDLHAGIYWLPHSEENHHENSRFYGRIEYWYEPLSILGFSAMSPATRWHYHRRWLCVLLWRHQLVSRRRRLYRGLEIPVCRSE